MSDELDPIITEDIDQQPKKNNVPLIIAIVVLVLLCCCCAVLVTLWYTGDSILQWLGITSNLSSQIFI